MAAVVLAAVGIVVVPLFVVDRYPHFGRIAMIQTIGTSVVLVPPEILWVVDVRIMVKSFPVLRTVGLTPRTTISLLGTSGVSLRRTTDKSSCAAGRQKDPADHRIPPLEDEATQLSSLSCGG